MISPVEANRGSLRRTLPTHVQLNAREAYWLRAALDLVLDTLRDDYIPGQPCPFRVNYRPPTLRVRQIFSETLSKSGWRVKWAWYAPLTRFDIYPPPFFALVDLDEIEKAWSELSAYP